jgi:hypothetical protein
MAINVLEKSETYVRQTEAAVRKRRDIICKYLKDNYKVTRGQDADVLAKIKAELESEGLEPVTDSLYETEKALLRSVYTWLTGDSEKSSIYSKASSAAKKIIDAFGTDNLKRWTDLGLGEALSDESAEDAKPARLKLEELTGGAELLGHLTAIGESVSRTVEENELLIEENKRVTALNDELTERINDVEEYNRYADEEITTLSDKLRGAHDNMRAVMESNLEQIADKYPEYPELAEIARKIGSGKGQRQQKLNELIARLPQDFKWQNDSGKVAYEQPFVKALGDLTADEQNQLIAQLEILATQGLEYASLHTRKIKYRLPNSPLNCFQSRVADHIRFTWTKNGKLTIHFLFRKGDSRVRQVES